LRVAAAGVGAVAADTVRRAAGTAPALGRTNFRGRTVSLAGGPALVLGATAAAAVGTGAPPIALGVLVAGLGAGAVGGYDDAVGGRPAHQAKGLRGHLAALREGRVTSGLIKIAGVGAAGLVAALLLPSGGRRRGTGAGHGAVPGAGHGGTGGRGRGGTGETGERGRGGAGGRGRGGAGLGRAVDVALGAGVIAGSANLVNLLDLRPGRALKVALLVAGPRSAVSGPAGGIAAGVTGAAGALLGPDLAEEIMLGDAGANALGALLGTSLVVRTGRIGRVGLLAGIAALTLASEKVSFTQVIERTPVLRELDALGRRTG
jgi:hypothetical protein